jgi:thioredoxin-like negative regulator of GroEL
MVARSMIEDLSDSNLERRIVDAKKILILEFWDPWCGICAEMAPIYAALAKKHRGKAIFSKLNMSDNRASPDRFQVYVTPTFIFFRDGKEVKRVGGLIDPGALEDEFVKNF